MAITREPTVKIDFSSKTATVGFAVGTGGSPLSSPHVSVHRVPWDTPGEQTETEIKLSAIRNAKQILQEVLK